MPLEPTSTPRSSASSADDFNYRAEFLPANPEEDDPAETLKLRLRNLGFNLDTPPDREHTTPGTHVKQPLLHEQAWALMWCTTADCDGNYQISNGTWTCTICATEITHIELAAADTFGDTFAGRRGFLQRRIAPNTRYRYTASGYTHTLTVNQLRETLHHAGLNWRERERILDKINRGGAVEHTPTPGTSIVNIRNTP